MIKKLLFIIAISSTLFSQNLESFVAEIELESPEKQLELLTKEIWQNRSKNPTYAIDLADVALSLAVELKNDKKLAELNNFLGVIYRNIGNYTKSLVYYNKALDIAVSINDSLQIAYSYNNIGGAYRLERNYTVALINMFHALEIFEKLNTQEGIGFCTINIGIVYKFQGNYTKAMEYFNRSLQIRENLGDKFGEAVTLNQIVEISYDQGEYSTALSKYEELLSIYEELNDPKGIAAVFGGIGGIKYHQGKYEEAKTFRELALDLNKKIQNTEGIINSYNELSIIYFMLGQIDKAKNAMQQSKIISSKSNNQSFLLTYYRYKSMYSEKIGALDSALFYYKNYCRTKDTLAAHENMASIASMESLYQVDLAAKENKILLNENKLRNDQAIFLLILAVVLIAFISFILHKYSQNKILNKELKELNATKDKFFSIVAHDLKSPFNNLLGYCELLVEDYESMTDVERKNSVSDLHTSSKKLVELVDNLLQWARANIGSFQYKPRLINLSEFANNLAGVFDELLSRKELVLNRKIDNNLNIYIDENYLNLVMRNLLNNAIKFSHPKSEINFIVEEKDTRIEIMLEDHGVGIEASKLDKVFELGQNVSTAGTLNEKGTGLGLILAHDLVIKWGGEISVTSSLGKGSTFKVTIPKTKATS